ncbi:MAG: LysM peptidoglycan-binding domain-containing protein [Ruminococcus sp.]|nr:LysM peptidoglycan-binding domain-containing protein [Ruminococcus sp.]
MKLAVMRYKGYAWEHNPQTLKICSHRSLSEQGVAGGSSVVRDFGERSRVITGSGRIAGDDCISKFAQLVALQNQSDSGILLLPDVAPFYAFFRSIELDCDPTPELITYKFEFVEDLSRARTEGEKSYHTVSKDETLWDISYRYGVEIERLAELNPEVKRVDELAAESRVRVC